MVGRLHYSLGPNPKCPIQVGESPRPNYFTALPSTGVLRNVRDYMDAGPDRSIRHLTYPYRLFSGGGSMPISSRKLAA